MGVWKQPPIQHGSKGCRHGALLLSDTRNVLDRCRVPTTMLKSARGICLWAAASFTRGLEPATLYQQQTHHDICVYKEMRNSISRV